MKQEIYFDCYCISAHLPLSHCTKSLRLTGATLSPEVPVPQYQRWPLLKGTTAQKIVSEWDGCVGGWVDKWVSELDWAIYWYYNTMIMKITIIDTVKSIYRNTAVVNICHYHHKFERSLYTVFTLDQSYSVLYSTISIILEYCDTILTIIVMVKSEYHPRLEWVNECERMCMHACMRECICICMCVCVFMQMSCFNQRVLLSCLIASFCQIP